MVTQRKLYDFESSEKKTINQSYHFHSTPISNRQEQLYNSGQTYNISPFSTPQSQTSTSPSPQNQQVLNKIGFSTLTEFEQEFKKPECILENKGRILNQKFSSKIDGKYYAVKMILKENLHMQILLNIQNLINIEDHPNLIKYYQSYLLNFSDNSSYFALKIQYGATDLDTQLKSRRKFSDKNLISMFKGGFDGLLFLKKQNVYHLNIKPSNIILMDFNIPLIIKFSDYGLTDNFNNGQQSITQITSQEAIYEFTAPEYFREFKFQGGNYNKEKLDVFSFGLSMLIAVIGIYKDHNSFKGSNITKSIMSNLINQVKRKDLQEMLQKMLYFNFQKRSSLEYLQQNLQIIEQKNTLV